MKINSKSLIFLSGFAAAPLIKQILSIPEWEGEGKEGKFSLLSLSLSYSLFKFFPARYIVKLPSLLSPWLI